MLGNYDLVLLRSDHGRNASKWFLKQLLMLSRGLHRAEKNIAGADLWQPRAKGDLYVDHGHSDRTCVIEDARRAFQESISVVLGVDRNDAGLAIHAQDGGARWIDPRSSCHIESLLVLVSIF